MNPAVRFRRLHGRGGARRPSARLRLRRRLAAVAGPRPRRRGARPRAPRGLARGPEAGLEGRRRRGPRFAGGGGRPRLRLRPPGRRRGRAGPRAGHGQGPLEAGLQGALHDEHGRDLPRQGSQVDPGGGRRTRLHLRHQRNPLRLRRRDGPRALAQGVRRAVQGDLASLRLRACRRSWTRAVSSSTWAAAASGALTAFDPATGNVLWAWKGDGPGYSSPVVARAGGPPPGRHLQRDEPRERLGGQGRAALEAAVHDVLGPERDHAHREGRPRHLLGPRPAVARVRASSRGALPTRRSRCGRTPRWPTT